MAPFLSSRAFVLSAMLLTVTCGRFPGVPREPGWGNERVLNAIKQVRVQDVRVATADLDRCPRQPRPLAVETVAGLLERIAKLRPASSIGNVGSWDRWRLLTIDCGEKGHYELFVGSRPSLNGAAILSIQAGTTSTEGGFYEGAEFWAWLKTVPEIAALATEPEAAAPCE